MFTAKVEKMVNARKWVVTKHFDGIPKRCDFDIINYELPPLKNGEVLIKTEWISVDPYLRAYNRNLQVPYDQFSFQVGIVQQTRDLNYPIGTRIVTNNGWCDYSVVNIADNFNDDVSSKQIYRLPDLRGMSPSLGISAVGMVGLTAYFGLLEICNPQLGETLVVTCAAGAVGSLVGQIAKLKGCIVIGFAGSDEKCIWLEKELGFDKALNYKKVDIEKALKTAAPRGVDCYFDNVGGEISSKIISQMNEGGRVSVCGSISTYNEDPKRLPKATILQPSLIFKQLKVEGFLVWRWLERYPEAFEQLICWIKSGNLKPVEHVTEGFENIFDAFVGMLVGENIGKAMVKT